MLRLDKIIKPWKESAALNDHINLYGFWNETTFLTKSGDVGVVLSVRGVDYESLDHAEQEYAVKRLEAALKAFGVAPKRCLVVGAAVDVVEDRAGQAPLRHRAEIVEIVATLERHRWLRTENQNRVQAAAKLDSPSI